MQNKIKLCQIELKLHLSIFLCLLLKHKLLVAINRLRFQIFRSENLTCLIALYFIVCFSFHFKYVLMIKKHISYYIYAFKYV